MSIAEMKLVAIKEIAKLEDESAIKEILEHIAKLPKSDKEVKSINLSQHYETIKSQFGNTLQKLAQ